MTHEEIDAMPAGREMDLLVAQEVFKWPDASIVNCLHYSTDPVAMMEVKAVLFKNNFIIETFWYISHDGKQNVVYVSAEHRDAGPQRPWRFCAAAEMGDDAGRAEAMCVCRVAMHVAVAGEKLRREHEQQKQSPREIPNCWPADLLVGLVDK